MRPIRLASDADEHFIACDGVEGIFRANQNFRPGLAVDDMRPNKSGAGARSPINTRHRAVRRRGANRMVPAENEPALLHELTQTPAKSAILLRRYPQLAR